MTEGLKFNYHDEINCFLILFNINKSRITFELKKNLYYYCLMFPIEDFGLMLVLFSHFLMNIFQMNNSKYLKKKKLIFF